jgi:hypothetical protein
VEIALEVRGDGLAVGPVEHQSPAVVITFYDQRRAVIDSQRLGPWTGSFAWRSESQEIAVPLTTRETIIRVGLLGGAGRLDVDNLRLHRVALP